MTAKKLQSSLMNYLSCANCLFISVLNCLIASLWRAAHYQLQRDGLLSV